MFAFITNLNTYILSYFLSNLALEQLELKLEKLFGCRNLKEKLEKADAI